MTLPLKVSESAFAHYLPYWHVGDGVMIMQDGAMALAFRLRGVGVECQPDEQVNELTRHLRAFLNVVPVGHQLQFLRRLRVLQDNSEFCAALKSSHPVLVEQRRHAAEHLKHLGLRTADTFLFLSNPQALGKLGSHQQGISTRFGGWLFGTKVPNTLTREQHVTAVEALQRYGKSLVRQLSSAGISLTPLSDSELVQVAYGFLNPGREEESLELADVHPPQVLNAKEKKLYRALSLREQLVHTSLNWDVDSLTLGDPMRLFRVMGLKSLPPRTLASLIQGATALSFPHWLSVSVSIPNSEEKFSEVERRRNRARASAVGYVRNVKADVQASELESVLEAMVARDQRVFHLALNAFFGGDNMAQLDTRTQEVVEVFRNRLAQTVVHTEQMAQLPAFLGMLPGNAHRATRRQTVLTDNAADFLPVYEAWHGDARPTFTATTRSGEPFNIDLTNPRRTNWNCTVFGGSGGGKTFLTLSLATSSMLGQNSPLIVIDVGGKELGSYYRLVDLLGGDFVGLSLDGSNCINPFFSRADLFTDDEGRPTNGPNELKLAFLLGIAKMLVTDPGAPALTRVAEGVLQRGILGTYSRLADSRPPILSDLVAELEVLKGDREEKEFARAFGKTLSALLQGPFGKLLNQQSKVNIQSSFVVFDLKGIEGLGDVAQVMLLVVSAYVWNMIARRRNELAWVVYDECWKLLMNPTAAELQSELYRTARKLKTGVVSITQKLEDFLAAPSSKAVLSNTTTTFLLKHKDGHEKVAELLSLNERELQLFRGLKAEKGFYSEFFLKQENGSAVVRYAPSPFDYWVNTTDPRYRELEARALQQLNGDRIATLRLLAKQFPNGATSAPLTN